MSPVSIKESLFLEIDFEQKIKEGQHICGDSFVVCKDDEQQRYVIVLSDGLGSGVKANILSSMTATMAAKFLTANMELKNSLQVIMDALPVCEVRKISYATFTIVDISLNGETRIIEMGNPAFVHLRNGAVVKHKATTMWYKRWEDRKIQVTSFKTKPEDRLVIMSDGITQAGLGNPDYKLGWRESGCSDYIQSVLTRRTSVSARQLGRMVVNEALKIELGKQPHDDITCGVIYFRKPRKLLLYTGPPFQANKDTTWAKEFNEYKGSKVICGGTTANIISRELDQQITTEMKLRGDLPPPSMMEGVSMVTEGILTLTRVSKLLREGGTDLTAANDLMNLLRDHDTIEIVVGTRINDAHQDPNFPEELDIRRNIIKQIRDLLTNKYLKNVTIKYF